MTATVCCRMFPLNIPRRFLRQTSTLRRCFRLVWIKIIVSTLGKKSRYQQLSCTAMSSLSPTTGDSQSEPSAATLSTSSDHTMDSSDIVTLKISLLGDSHIGKTSFLAKYAGMERRGGGLDGAGLNQIDKTLCVGGAARIAYTIWNLKGDGTSHIQIPTTCKDSVAMLFMFDLTSRCTLNRIIKWYQEARKWNQTAIPVLIGTKFDEFVQLPIDLQWTIANQARTYAKAMNASLFFSSATYNINVNKVFKFITAKLFNLPWTLERNLTVGEPIIDF